MHKTPLEERIQGWLFVSANQFPKITRVLLHKNDMEEAMKLYKTGFIEFDGRSLPIECLGKKYE